MLLLLLLPCFRVRAASLPPLRYSPNPSLLVEVDLRTTYFDRSNEVGRQQQTEKACPPPPPNLFFSSIAAVQSVTASGKICILDIDVQGVKSVRNAGQSVLDPHYLFISAPSMEVLEARLRGRWVRASTRRRKSSAGR